jgi:hypothetical protein
VLRGCVRAQQLQLALQQPQLKVCHGLLHQILPMCAACQGDGRV